jgi:hypothetical protein
MRRYVSGARVAVTQAVGVVAESVRGNLPAAGVVFCSWWG